jgi:hypothetical protein
MLGKLYYENIKKMLAVFGLHVVGFKIIIPTPTNRIGITVPLT